MLSQGPKYNQVQRVNENEESVFKFHSSKTDQKRNKSIRQKVSQKKCVKTNKFVTSQQILSQETQEQDIIHQITG